MTTIAGLVECLNRCIEDRDDAVSRGDEDMIALCNDAIGYFMRVLEGRETVTTPIQTETVFSSWDQLMDTPMCDLVDESGISRFQRGAPEVAIKHDSDKIRMELLPTSALGSIAEVLTIGAQKYGDHNWANGFKWSRLYGAALRHLTAHMSGEDFDDESGMSHLAHAGATIMFLIAHEAEGLGDDDRRQT